MRTRVECFLTQLSKVVVMCCEYIAAVVSGSLYFGYYIKALIILEKFILHIDFDSLSISREVRSCPDYRFFPDSLSICLVELERCLPCVNHSGIAAIFLTCQLPEVCRVLVCEHEITYDKSTFVFRPCKIGKNLIRIIVQCVDMVKFEFTLD